MTDHNRIDGLAFLSEVRNGILQYAGEQRISVGRILTRSEGYAFAFGTLVVSVQPGTPLPVMRVDAPMHEESTFYPGTVEEALQHLKVYPRMHLRGPIRELDEPLTHPIPTHPDALLALVDAGAYRLISNDEVDGDSVVYEEEIYLSEVFQRDLESAFRVPKGLSVALRDALYKLASGLDDNYGDRTTVLNYHRLLENLAEVFVSYQLPDP